MEPLISVIIPVYRVELYLDTCILSVVAQTYKNLEIILVDDGSPDRCGIICDEWGKKDSRIKVIHQKNGGLSCARNTALDIASGEYVAFVDSDDCIAPTMLEKLLRTIEHEKAGIAECNYIFFADKIPPYNVTVNSRVSCFDTEEALSILLDESKFKCVVWNKLYKKEIFNAVKFEVGKIHEDVFFTYQAFGLTSKIAKLEEPLYFYRQRSGSIMQQDFSIHNLDALEGKKRQYFYMKHYFPDLSAKAQSQVLGSCLYLGQKALRCPDIAVVKSALEWIQPVFHEIYTAQTIEEPIKQKLWYYAAKRNFPMCCSIRNKLKIGL